MSESDTSSSDDNSAQGDDIYADDVERQWGEASSIRGVDPELLDQPASAPGRRRAPQEPPAAVSPWLIPFAAILNGPLVAAVLTVFTDGDPPAPRQIIAVLCTGLTAWVINVGLASTDVQVLAERTEAMIRFGVLVGSGAILWAMYTFWIQGRRRANRFTMRRSAVVLIVLSAVFWFGHATEPGWWAWMGR